MGGGERMTTKEEKMEILRLSDIPLQEVKWLWYPYIPFGKITIIQTDCERSQEEHRWHCQYQGR